MLIDENSTYNYRPDYLRADETAAKRISPRRSYKCIIRSYIGNRFKNENDNFSRRSITIIIIAHDYAGGAV